MTPLATLDLHPPVATLTLNRGEQHNALSIGLLDALHARVNELSAREDITVLVLTGAGRSFCAGMDLKEVLLQSPADAAVPARLLASLGELTLKLRALPMVVIAKVNGAAIGGGCGLTCVCDFAVTHADAKMGFPEVDLGLCPAVVAPWLVRRLGAGPARSVLLHGGIMSGREAHHIGLVSDLVETREQLDAAVSALAQRLASGGALALRATKALLNELDGSLDASLTRRGAELSARVLTSPDAQARLRARATKG